jgi:protoporphyrinogen IX oxidase
MAYIKALHIIFVVTWFAGMFYMPRLFIYNTEAADRAPAIADALREQFTLMMKRLWFGITWPSAILTLIFGPWVMIISGWWRLVFDETGKWLLLKLIFVLGLYAYHFSLHRIFKQQSKGIFRYSSQQLRLWNEVATIFLVAIVMLVVVKQGISLVWGLGGLVALVLALMTAIRIYKLLRK